MRMLLLFIVLISLQACGRSPEFPENQRIEGPFEITEEWQIIHFDEPLRINRSGMQALHFVLDNRLYSMNDHSVGGNFSHLMFDDGKVLEPEVFLIGPDGQEEPVTAVSNRGLPTGGLTMGFGPWRNIEVSYLWPAQPPHYTERLESFRAVKIRANVPFTAHYLWWHMDFHPEYNRCGHRRCSWIGLVLTHF